eukprot:m.111508 g.111508  ORF g.111508 m.111508 type:complete len:59 (+) comp12764_c6_seq3:636-812(+)
MHLCLCVCECIVFMLVCECLCWLFFLLFLQCRFIPSRYKSFSNAMNDNINILLPLFNC